MASYLVRHLTRYNYDDPVLQSHNLMCLKPRTLEGQTVEAVRVKVDPEPEWEDHWGDVYGNLRDSFSFSSPHDTLTIQLMARIERVEPVQPVSHLTWEQAILPHGAAWQEAPPLMREFRCPSPLLPIPGGPILELEDCLTPNRNVLEVLQDIMGRVHDQFTYDPKATTTFTPLEEVRKKKAGVCQDFAHAAVAELRRIGFAAGYVSGYLETDPPPGREKLRGADATHAWYAVYIPDCGWVHYDPTNNVIPGDRHLISAWGRDYGDVAPVKGVLFGGGKHQLDVEVDVWSWPDRVPADILQEWA